MKIVLAYLICIAPAFSQVNYNGKNQMLRPEKYSEWIWLSSGYRTARFSNSFMPLPS